MLESWNVALKGSIVKYRIHTQNDRHPSQPYPRVKSSGPLPPPACLSVILGILERPYSVHQRLHDMLQARRLPLQLLVLRLKLHGLDVHLVILRL